MRLTQANQLPVVRLIVSDENSVKRLFGARRMAQCDALQAAGAQRLHAFARGR